MTDFQDSPQRITSQHLLWNQQHQKRGIIGREGNELLYVPNKSALAFCHYLPPQAIVLEVGCANGRDARHFAIQGHRVFGVDFSEVALDQMMQIAQGQDVYELITAIQHDYSDGSLPLDGDSYIHGFYARSSLHLDDKTMLQLAKNVTALLAAGGIILIEGKSINDPKVRSSELIEGNLAINWQEGGHLRRIWSEDFFRMLCESFSWEILFLASVTDEVNPEASFLRLIARKN